jgi:hypothetical protein
VELVAVEVVVRVGGRVGVVEPRHQADVDDVVAHRVDPAAAEGVPQRRAQGVDHAARRQAARHAPELLDADRVHHRVAALVQAQAADGGLGERAARAFAQHHDLGHQVRAGLVVGLLLAGVRDALVADAHADHPVALPQQLLAGEGGEHVDPGFFRLGGEPLGQVRERPDVLAVVVERGRRERRRDLALVGEEPQRVAADRGVEAAGDVLAGEELQQRLGVDHGAREAVVADLAALLDHHDGDLRARRGGELAQPDRAGE